MVSRNAMYRKSKGEEWHGLRGWWYGCAKPDKSFGGPTGLTITVPQD